MKVGPIDRLYALLPGQSHDQRSRIENTDQLVRYLSMIDETDEYIDILYVYPTNEGKLSWLKFLVVTMVPVIQSMSSRLLQLDRML
jgi:hypothetical protein